MGRVLKGQKLLNARSVIFSQWDGYLKNKKQFWDENQVKIVQIHTSGHAYAEDLKKLANAIKPKYIIPIHTQEAEKYEKYFKFPVKPLQDGKKVPL
jgi:ribonuclease J